MPAVGQSSPTGPNRGSIHGTSAGAVAASGGGSLSAGSVRNQSTGAGPTAPSGGGVGNRNTGGVSAGSVRNQSTGAGPTAPSGGGIGNRNVGGSIASPHNMGTLGGLSPRAGSLMAGPVNGGRINPGGTVRNQVLGTGPTLPGSPSSGLRGLTGPRGEPIVGPSSLDSLGIRDQFMTDPMAHMIGRGWTPEMAAGMVGNLMQESGMRQNPPPSSEKIKAEKSYGVAQWRDARLQGLTDYANTMTPGLMAQLDYMDRELRGTSPYVDKGAVRAGKALMADPKMSAAKAAGIISNQYERPNVRLANNANRVREANKALAGVRSNLGSVPSISSAPSPDNMPSLQMSNYETKRSLMAPRPAPNMPTSGPHYESVSAAYNPLSSIQTPYQAGELGPRAPSGIVGQKQDYAGLSVNPTIVGRTDAYGAGLGVQPAPRPVPNMPARSLTPRSLMARVSPPVPRQAPRLGAPTNLVQPARPAPRPSVVLGPPSRNYNTASLGPVNIDPRSPTFGRSIFGQPRRGNSDQPRGGRKRQNINRAKPATASQTIAQALVQQYLPWTPA